MEVLYSPWRKSDLLSLMVCRWGDERSSGPDVHAWPLRTGFGTLGDSSTADKWPSHGLTCDLRHTIIREYDKQLCLNSFVWSRIYVNQEQSLRAKEILIGDGEKAPEEGSRRYGIFPQYCFHCCNLEIWTLNVGCELVLDQLLMVWHEMWTL